MCAYYLQKGIKPEEILKLTPKEKRFYFASMVWWSEKNKIEV
jgi:hypothetical protein